MNLELGMMNGRFGKLEFGILRCSKVFWEEQSMGKWVCRVSKRSEKYVELREFWVCIVGGRFRRLGNKVFWEGR